MKLKWNFLGKGTGCKSKTFCGEGYGHFLEFYILIKVYRIVLTVLEDHVPPDVDHQDQCLDPSE